MLSRKVIEEWLAQNHLDQYGYDRLIAEEARLEALQSSAASLIGQYIIDHLRATGDYARLAARAQDKKNALSSKSMDETEPEGIAALRLTAWFFEQRLGRDIPDDVGAFASSLGFADVADFHRALLREYVFVSPEE